MAVPSSSFSIKFSLRESTVDSGETPRPQNLKGKLGILMDGREIEGGDSPGGRKASGQGRIGLAHQNTPTLQLPLRPPF